MSEPIDTRRWRAVCVHGAGGGAWEWAIWSRVLGAHAIEVVSADLQAAAGGLADTRFADYRAQVAAWCRNAAGDGVALVLVGASLGGLLALAVAAETRVDALVLVNAMPPAGVVARLPATNHPALVPWRSARTLQDTLRALPDADDAAVLHAFRRWRDESGAVLNEAQAGIAIDWPTCPALVLASGRDDDVPAFASRALAVRLGADFECLREASHVGPLLGAPSAAAAARVVGWLGQRSGKRA